MTSFDVIRRLKRIIPGVKLGHLGTLDPMAEGVLPVAVGGATRLIEYITDKSKTYVTQMTLGGVSDTQDIWGNITFQPECNFDSQKLREILPRFIGNIKQIPPMYSAVHHQGKRLYEIARQGLVVEREPRNAFIHKLQLLNINQDRDKRITIDLEIACSEGTYIRTLCHDIGQALGTGAFMSSLVRSKWGVFLRENTVTLDTLQTIAVDDIKKYILPADYPLQDIPKINIYDQVLINKIINGNLIPAQITSEQEDGLFRVYPAAGSLICIARAKKSNYNDQWFIQPLKVLI